MISDKEIVCPNNLLDVAHQKKGILAGIVNAGKSITMMSVMDAVNENLISPIFIGDKDEIEKCALELNFDISEFEIINEIKQFQDVIRQCKKDLEIHPLCFYLRDLASKFHSYYNANKFIEEEKDLRDAKFVVVLAIKKVIKEGLGILSISAPERM